MRLITLAALAATLLGAVPSQAANDTTKNAPGSSPPVSTQTPTVTVTTPANDDSAASQATPQVFYGDADLPAPVRELRQKLLTAIKTGELESLRPIFAANGGNPDLPGGESDDPIATLKLLAGDPKGREILAIMEASSMRLLPAQYRENYDRNALVERAHLLRMELSARGLL